MILYKALERNWQFNQFKEDLEQQVHCRREKDNLNQIVCKSPFPRFSDGKKWTTVLQERLYHHRFTCNHTHAFLIDDDDKPWVCSVARDSVADLSEVSQWIPLFWDGYGEQRARSIHADGANLAIVDNENRIHYRKIIKEKLVSPGIRLNNTNPPLQISNNGDLLSLDFTYFSSLGMSACKDPTSSGQCSVALSDSCALSEKQGESQPKFKQQSCSDGTLRRCKRLKKPSGTYRWKDKLSRSAYWNPGWALSVFPFDHYSKRLSLPLASLQTCCISHRGLWNGYVRDHATGCIVDELKSPQPGCTTFYYSDGVSVYLADPMNVLGFSVQIELPRVEDAESEYLIDCSASCLFYFRKILTQNPSPKWQAWARFVDYDLLKKVPHVSFYKDCATSWFPIQQISLDETLNKSGVELDRVSIVLCGTKIHNMGQNTRIAQLWFQISKKADPTQVLFMIKSSLLLPDTCFALQQDLESHPVLSQLRWRHHLIPLE